MQEEIEAAQQDPHVLTIVNALIDNNRDKYLSLLIQNGAKLPTDFDISSILSPGVMMNHNTMQTSNMPVTIHAPSMSQNA